MNISERRVGPSAKPIVEVRLSVPRPGRDPGPLIPITIFDLAVRMAALKLAPGSPITVLARLEARTWTGDRGIEKTFFDVIGDQVLVGVAAGLVAPASATTAVPDETTAPA